MNAKVSLNAKVLVNARESQFNKVLNKVLNPSIYTYIMSRAISRAPRAKCSRGRCYTYTDVLPRNGHATTGCSSSQRANTSKDEERLAHGYCPLARFCIRYCTACRQPLDVCREPLDVIRRTMQRSTCELKHIPKHILLPCARPGGRT